MRPNLQWLFVVTLTLSASAFGQSPSDSGSNPVKSLFSYVSGVLSPTWTKFEDLVKTKQFEPAGELYIKERAYFDALKGDDANILTPLAEYQTAKLTQTIAPLIDSLRVQAASGALDDPSNWATIKDLLRQCESAVGPIDAVTPPPSPYVLLTTPRYRTLLLEELFFAHRDLKLALQRDAPIAFTRYPHWPVTPGNSTVENAKFGNQYPISTDMFAVLNAAFSPLEPILRNRNSRELIAFGFDYAFFFSKANIASFSAILKQKKLEEDGDTLKARIEIYRSLVDQKIPTADVLETKLVLLANESSSTMISFGDSPVPVDKLSSLPVQLPAGPSRFFTVFQVSDAAIDRKVMEKRDQSSQFVSGVRVLPNPYYEVVRARYYQAESTLRNLNSQARLQGWAAVAQVLAQTAAEIARTQAFNEFQGTPPTREEDALEDYNYQVSVVRVKKVLSGEVAVIDNVAKTFLRFPLVAEDNKTFSIAYNVHKKDASPSATISAYDKETAIDEYEKLAFDVKWMDVLANARNVEAQPFKASAELFSARKSPQFVAVGGSPKGLGTGASIAVDDPRFDSVVIILTPKGRGSGFYVAPDLVLTNQHVVEGVGFVEVKQHGGKQSFGKVVRTDLNLDLALIRVADLGKPLEFHTSSIPVGTTVDLIGHPQGLEYTLTRGIVSAVRKMSNPFVKGGNQVTYIQTDAGINPGNSGGPMLYKDKVIGVNTQKMGRGAQGLGFAVHFAEVLKFLQE